MKYKLLESKYWYELPKGIKRLAYKPDSVEDSHSSRRCVTTTLEQPTRIQRGSRQRIPIWSYFRWGLPCRSCYHVRGALLPHHFNLTCVPKAPSAVYFLLH